MKVLVVASGNRGCLSPFVTDQVDALRAIGVAVDVFLIRGRGVRGYLGNVPALRRRIAAGQYDVVHAHSGLTGAAAALQRKLPVIVTFHGSDVEGGFANRWISRLAARRAAYCVFVNSRLREQTTSSRCSAVIPCGVNLGNFHERDRKMSRQLMGLDSEGTYVLFGSTFDAPIKNPQLAKEAVQRLGDDKVQLLELRGYSRDEVPLVISASNVVLLPSTREGSPQIVKEALACNCPVVVTDVGDVREIVGGVEGCYVTPRDPEAIADNLRRAIAAGRADGRERAQKYDNRPVARRILAIYETVVQGG